MEDQYFSTTHNPTLFDLNGCTPMGFSPSIDGSNGLPFSFGDGIETPSFMLEVQRKRADTTATLKPDFNFKESLDVDEDGIEIDIPQRKRAAQRLSLASSIASSAPSTATSDAEGNDFNGFDSETSPSAGSPWSTSEQQGFDEFVSNMTLTDREPDLVNWRSSAMQSSLQPVDGPSPLSSNVAGPEFSFADFIDENPQNGGATVDHSTVRESESHAQRPSLPSFDSAGSLSTGSSSCASEAAPATPSSLTGGSDDLDGKHEDFTVDASFVNVEHLDMTNVPSFEHFTPQPGFVPHPQLLGVPIPSGAGWPIARPMGSVDGAQMPPMPFGAENYRAPGMMFSQSAPSHAAAQLSMYAASLIDSPVPSSPACSARSTSPFTSSPHGVFPSSSPLMQSPNSHQMPLQHLQSPQDNNVPSSHSKGMNLLSQFAHLANPYAGLITKRSRGRRVPSKPEEMNNLGKSGKVYTCKVPGCGKCFKRSEHLKRHVRSIHTDEKPFMCPFPNCHKRFSRHDNLNQHARVHAPASGAPVRGSISAGGQPVDMNGMPPMSLGQPNFGDMSINQEMMMQAPSQEMGQLRQEDMFFDDSEADELQMGGCGGSGISAQGTLKTES